MLDKNIQERVEREKDQHDDDAILERAIELKSTFDHVLNSPTMQRADKEESQIYKNVKDKIVLDVGCGFGEKSITIAQNGGVVTGIDISENYIRSSRQSAQEKNLNHLCSFEEMDVHNMSYKDNTFDLVIGRGIIHHLDLQVSLTEIKRVLKPGGTAIFLEPLSANPLLKIFRVLTPSARTVDEKPLTIRDLKWINSNFDVYSSYYGLITAPVAMLTSILLRPWPNNYILIIFDYLENFLNKLNFIKPFNQYVLLNIKKPS